MVSASVPMPYKNCFCGWKIRFLIRLKLTFQPNWRAMEMKSKIMASWWGLRRSENGSHSFGFCWSPCIHFKARVIFPLAMSLWYCIYSIKDSKLFRAIGNKLQLNDFWKFRVLPILQYSGLRSFLNWFAFCTKTAVLIADPPDAVIFWPLSSSATALPFSFLPSGVTLLLSPSKSVSIKV